MSLRDARVDREWLEDARRVEESVLPRRLDRVRAATDAEAGQLAVAARTAKTLSGSLVDLVRFGYALGDDLEQVALLVDRAALLRAECFAVMEKYDETAYPGFLQNGYAFRMEIAGSYADAIDMLSWTGIFGLRERASSEWSSPPVKRWGDGVLDRLAELGGVDVGEVRKSLALPVVWSERWPGLVSGDPDEASTMLTEYVRSWNQRHGALFGQADSSASHFRGSWCFDAAAVAVGLGVDDTAARGVLEYPADLVDYARGVRHG